MKKLYEKNEVLFAVFWIIVYCLLTIPIRGNLGDGSGLMTIAPSTVKRDATPLVLA